MNYLFILLVVVEYAWKIHTQSGSQQIENRFGDPKVW